MPRRSTRSKRRGTRRRQRGGFYGAVGALAPGAMQWGRGSEMGEHAIGSRGGNSSVMIGAGRRRRTSRRRMSGGNRFGATYASFQGTGSRGLGNVVAGTHKPNVPFGGQFNNYGAGPGNFKSF